MFLQREANPETANLGSLSAYLHSLRGDDEAALAQLREKTDPESIHLALDIFLHAKRYAEAAALIRDLAPHERWCDQAVSALVWVGEPDPARRILEWSKSLQDRTTRRRCLLMFGASRYERALSARDASQPIFPGDLTSQEQEAIRDAVEAIQPILLLVQGNERIDNELESQAVQLALHIFSLLGEYEQCSRLAELLTTRTPVPLTLAQFALQHLILVPKDLPERLRMEHPDSFSARLLAIMVEADQLERVGDAFNSAKQLVPQVASNHDREALCQVLNDVGQKLGPEVLAEVDTIASCLLQDDHPLRKLLRVDRLLRAYELEQARMALEAIRDESDPRWLQLYANYLLQIGDGTSATDYFAKASALFPHPDLLRMTAEVAFDFDRPAIAAEALERLVAQEPGAILPRKNLAAVYIRQKHFEKAAQQFAVLRELEPDNLGHAVNHAISLMQSGHLYESLQVYNNICSLGNPPLGAILGRAYALTTLGRPEEAFASLYAIREQYWNSPEFVSAMLNVAFSAQREEVGHEALMRLRQLQIEGTAPPGILQLKSLDDLKEEMRKYRERTDLIHRQVLQGKWPWLLAEMLLGHISYLAWLFRTQPLTWLGDDPISRAQFAIYSTNSFSVYRAEDAPPSLERIECPSGGTTVVVDLSALITLHRLGLLDEAAQFFGELHIPTIYLSNAVVERRRLVPHQPSQIKTIQAIHGVLETGAILVLDDLTEPNQRIYPYVNEYTMDDDTVEHFYRSTDIIAVLHATGRIDDSKQNELAVIAQKSSGVDMNHPPLEPNQKVLIELSTLRMLCQFGVLDAVVDAFHVHIMPSDRDEILAGLRANASQENIRQWHSELWDIIRNDGRFILKPYIKPKEWKDDRNEADVFLAAAFLAQEERIPLLADDRTLQGLLLNSRPTERFAAFGTDRLLLSLEGSGRLDANRVAEGFMQLIEWRYRFVITPPAVLKTIADHFMTHPPGRSLVSIARYVHDCMRDPGLFAGFEPTEPPVTVANRLFLSWSTVVAEFVMEVWADPRYNDESAMQLTDWAIRELLPSPPKTMGYNASALVSMTAKIVMNRALIRSCQMDNVSRANQGLRAISAGLGMTAEDYFVVVSEVIDAI